MEIKITTITNTKLSKSFLNQMYCGENKQVLNGCTVLGYVIGVVKNKHKAVLIEYDGDYYILATNWEKGEKAISRRTGQYSRKFGYFHQTKKFNTAEECDVFWNLLQNTLDKATEHIYI